MPHQYEQTVAQHILHATERATVYKLGAPVLHQEQVQDADARDMIVRGSEYPFYVYSTHLLYPNPDYIMPFITSDVSYSKLFRSCALGHPFNSNNFAGVMLPLKTGNAIADSGRMQIFVMEGTPVINKRNTKNPLSVSLANGRQVSTTQCLSFLAVRKIAPELFIFLSRKGWLST